MFQHAVKLQMPLKHLTSSMKIVWRTLVAKFYSVSPHKWNSDFFLGGVMTWSCMLRQAGFFLNVLSWTISGSNLVDRAVTMSESLLSAEETDQFLGESWTKNNKGCNKMLRSCEILTICWAFSPWPLVGRRHVRFKDRVDASACDEKWWSDVPETEVPSSYPSHIPRNHTCFDPEEMAMACQELSSIVPRINM